MNVYSSQPLEEFIDQLRLVAERQRFGPIFIGKLDELADLSEHEEEIERLQYEIEELQARVADLSEQEEEIERLQYEIEELRCRT